MHEVSEEHPQTGSHPGVFGSPLNKHKNIKHIGHEAVFEIF